MMQKALLAPVLFGVLLAGCQKTTETTKLQYMPDMADSPAVKTQQSFIDPPPHSVSMNAILYPKTVDEGEKLLRNPMPPSEEVVAAGKHAFDTFCIPCHGADAKGVGSLGDKYPRPPDITQDPYPGREDGFFFYRITFGSAIMPGYGHAISPMERWQIVHYLRTLQKKGG